MVFLHVLSFGILVGSGMGHVPIVLGVSLILTLSGLLRVTGQMDRKQFGFGFLFAAWSIGSAMLHTGNASYAAGFVLLPATVYSLGALNGKERIEIKRWVLFLLSLLSLWAITSHTGGRLSGAFSNANLMGIVLVMVLLSGPEDWQIPILSMGLFLTLSMGSFLAFFLGLLMKRDLAGKALPGCILGLFGVFLAGTAWYSVLLAALGVFVAIPVSVPCAWPVMLSGTVLLPVLRPTAILTFLERFSMMGGAISEMISNLMIGIGPYQFSVRFPTFDTFFVHNAFLHVALEFGLISGICLFLFYWQMRRSVSIKAFFVHLCLDIGFFYEAIPYLGLLLFKTNGQRLPLWIWRTIGIALSLLIGFLLILEVII